MGLPAVQAHAFRAGKNALRILQSFRICICIISSSDLLVKWQLEDICILDPDRTLSVCYPRHALLLSSLLSGMNWRQRSPGEPLSLLAQNDGSVAFCTPLGMVPTANEETVFQSFSLSSNSLPRLFHACGVVLLFFSIALNHGTLKCLSFPVGISVHMQRWMLIFRESSSSVDTC